MLTVLSGLALVLAMGGFAAVPVRLRILYADQALRLAVFATMVFRF